MSKNIYLKAEGHSFSTREPYSDDDWDRGDSHTDWSFGDAFLTSNPYYGSISVDDSYNVGDEVFLVVAIWSTGDSFGNDSGSNQEIISVHKTIGNAEKSKELIEVSGSFEYNYETISLPDGFELRYCPWNGYFEGLDSVTIERRILKPLQRDS